ncbi:hypothetical protein BDV23DRAFT_177444 [Aspergillus alliaceus]|uniref:Uncharacterized protein n=1 Tax=Petromyces alliaceus TaxID=209559 RepID=A0A5N7CQP3_PETAA|nr:hypothetical protein BDV23DRAFT_177444 [Aspergillus alliaceus]
MALRDRSLASPDSTLQRKRATHHTASTRESFESSPSDASSIYNAVRASSGLEDLVLKSNGTLGSRMAANMAMFVSPSSEYTTTKPPKPDIEHKAKRPWWHTYLLSDSHILSPKDDRQRVKIPMPELSPKADQHRKAASVNDADARLRAPKWLASLASPASPVLPTYPPPVRSPTPPGLPSFGTEEALRYSARFPVDSGLANGQSHQRRTHGSAGKGNRVESYGEALRRFFGISSSSAFRPNGRGCTVVRAADGTVVQGRLPHRQSSHGVGAGGRLVDHPFHRRNLSTTQFDSVGENGGAVVHTQPLDTGNYSNMRRKNSLHSGIARPPISRLQISSSNLSPGPNHSAIPPSRAALTHPAYLPYQILNLQAVPPRGHDQQQNLRFKKDVSCLRLNMAFGYLPQELPTPVFAVVWELGMNRARPPTRILLPMIHIQPQGAGSQMIARVNIRTPTITRRDRSKNLGSFGYQAFV